MSISRRSLLGAAAAPVVFQLVEGGKPAKAAAGPNDQLGFGFIGVGVRGSQLLDAFKKIDGVRTVIAADLYDGYLAHAKEATGGKILTTKDYRAVLKRSDVDAVVIATPDHWHRPMILEALDAGKHVYIEKPLTLTIEEGPQLVAAAEASKKVVQVGSQPKTSPLTAVARDLIASGELGKVHMVRMTNNRGNGEGAWRYPIPPDASPKTIDWKRFHGPVAERPFSPEVFFRWRCWWEYSGGVASDLFVHLLTQLHEMLNVKAPRSVVAQGGLFRWNDGRTVPDYMNALFEYADGPIVDMYVNQCNGRTPHPNLIAGTAGTLTLEQDRLQFYAEEPDKEIMRYASLAWPEEARKQYLKRAEDAASARTLEKAKDREIKIPSGLSHYELFVDSIRRGLPSRETAREGHLAAGAAHLANLAYRRGRKLVWDHQTNEVREA